MIKASITTVCVFLGLTGCIQVPQFQSEKIEITPEVIQSDLPGQTLAPKFWLDGGVFSISKDNQIYFVDLLDKSIIRKASLENINSVQVFFDLKEWLKLDSSLKFQIDEIWVDEDESLILAEAQTGKVIRVSNDARKLEILADSYDGYRLSKFQGLMGSPKNDIFVGAPHSATIYRLDTKTGKLHVLNEDLVRSNDFAMNSRGDRLLVAESQPNRVVVYDLESTDPESVSWNLIKFKSPHEKPISLSILDSKSKFLGVLLGRGKQLGIFDLERGKLIQKIYLPVACSRIRAHGKWIYLQSSKGIIRKKSPLFLDP